MSLFNRLLGEFGYMPLYAPDAGGAPGGADPGAAATDPGKGVTDPAASGTKTDPAKGTLADGGAADPAAAAAAAAAAKTGTWPDAWRDQLAEQIKPGDKAFRTRLDRMASPADIGKSWLELEGKVSSGKLKAVPEPLPENATAEQKAEWRKTNGLPETPEALVAGLKLPDGVVVGENDKALVGDFAKQIFEQGGSQAEMDRAVSFYYGMQDKAAAAQKEADGDFRVNSEVALKTEWGADFKPNMAAFGAFKAQIPEDVQAVLFSARTMDGRLLGDTPEFLKIGAAIGRELNPAAAIVLQGGADMKSVDTELASIEATFRKAVGGDAAAHREYYGTDGKPGLEARMRELITTREKMAAKGKAA